MSPDSMIPGAIAASHWRTESPGLRALGSLAVAAAIYLPQWILPPIVVLAIDTQRSTTGLGCTFGPQPDPRELRPDGCSAVDGPGHGAARDPLATTPDGNHATPDEVALSSTLSRTGPAAWRLLVDVPVARDAGLRVDATVGDDTWCVGERAALPDPEPVACGDGVSAVAIHRWAYPITAPVDARGGGELLEVAIVLGDDDDPHFARRTVHATLEPASLSGGSDSDATPATVDRCP